METREKLTVRSATVLLISDDAAFSRSITTRWQSQSPAPAFTILSGDLWPRTMEGFEVAIVGPVVNHSSDAILEALQAALQPVFCVCQDEASLLLLKRRWPYFAALRMHEDWLDSLILAAREALGRRAAEARAEAADLRCTLLERQAALGRYMLEMRHGLNNALTSLLGNSDLLLLAPENLPAPARSQIETIRSMTLRINEVMQRFSSLEKEMLVAAQQAERESEKFWVAAAARQ